jgi:hypothetical protein
MKMDSYHRGRLIMWILVSLFILGSVYTFIDMKQTNYYETDLHLSHQQPPFIKNGALSFLKPEYSYGNRTGDTIFSYKYDSDKEILYWKILEYNSVSMTRVSFIQGPIDVRKKFISSKITITIGSYPPHSLIFNDVFKPAINLKVNIDPDGKIDTTIISPGKCIYHSLNFSNLQIFGDNGLDITCIKTPIPTDLMLLKYKGIFYFILMYSTDNSPLKSNLLYNIVNLNQ